MIRVPHRRAGRWRSRHDPFVESRDLEVLGGDVPVQSGGVALLVPPLESRVGEVEPLVAKERLQLEGRDEIADVTEESLLAVDRPSGRRRSRSGSPAPRE